MFEIVTNARATSSSRSLKQARERLDYAATKSKGGWRRVQMIGQDLFGKTKDFNISECKQIRERIREC